VTEFVKCYKDSEAEEKLCDLNEHVCVCGLLRAGLIWQIYGYLIDLSRPCARFCHYFDFSSILATSLASRSLSMYCT
jgi:hypothetical protein